MSLLDRIYGICSVRTPTRNLHFVRCELQGRHYQGNEARSSDNDGDDDEWDNDIDNSDDKNDDDNDDDDVNPDSNRKDYERGDLLSKILHHRSRRQTETRKKPKRKFRVSIYSLLSEKSALNLGFPLIVWCRDLKSERQ